MQQNPKVHTAMQWLLFDAFCFVVRYLRGVFTKELREKRSIGKAKRLVIQNLKDNESFRLINAYLKGTERRAYVVPVCRVFVSDGENLYFTS